MCLVVDDMIMLGLSLAMTAAGTAVNYAESQASMDQYNNQVSENNKLITEEYARRQAQNNAADAASEQTAQDAFQLQYDAEEEDQRKREESWKQREATREDKQESLAETLARINGSQTAADTDTATAARTAEYQNTGESLPSYQFGGGSDTPEVVKASAARRLDSALDTGRKTAEALSRVGAASDVFSNTDQALTSLGQQLSNLDTDNYYGNKLILRENNTLEDSLARYTARQNALKNVVSRNASNPYYQKTIIKDTSTSGVGNAMTTLGSAGFTKGLTGTGFIKSFDTLPSGSADDQILFA